MADLSHPRWHRGMLMIALIGGLSMGCNPSRQQRQAQMPPDAGETLPEWAFDAPFYFQPPTEAVPQPTQEPPPDLPGHYYVNQHVFMIDRPENNVRVDRAPRIAVYWTDTSGAVWMRAGYFGLGQSFFAFVAGDDGDYGIRFVGPGIRESLTPQTVPHRIYHVDTRPPVVKLQVEPDVTLAQPEDMLTVTWTINDANLAADTARFNICWSGDNPTLIELFRPEAVPSIDVPTGPFTPAAPPATLIWRPLKADIPPCGSFTYTVPADAHGQTFRFQVRIKDRAGNYGIGYSKPILVPADAPATQPAETLSAAASR